MATGKDGFEALTIGRRVTFSKTISESDVYLFAGITGDLSPNHVDEEYMRKTPYGRRIARPFGRPVPRRHGRRRDQDRATRRDALGAQLVGRRRVPERRQCFLPPRPPEPAQPDAR